MHVEHGGRSRSMRHVVMLTWALLVSATHMPSFVGAGVAMAQEHREASKRAREARSAWAEGIMDTGGGELQVCPLLVDQVIGAPRYADGLQPLGSKRARTGSTDGNDAAPMDTESAPPAADADALRTVLDLEPESRPVDLGTVQPMESASTMVVVQSSAVYANGSDDARLLEQLEREEAAFVAQGQARSRMEHAIAAIKGQ